MQFTKRATEAIMAALPQLDGDQPWSSEVQLSEVTEIAEFLGYEVSTSGDHTVILGPEDAGIVIAGILMFGCQWSVEGGSRLVCEPMLLQLLPEQSALGGLLTPLVEHDLWLTKSAKLMCSAISAMLAERRGAEGSSFDLPPTVRLVDRNEGVYDLA